jgi:hypothetical protein
MIIMKELFGKNVDGNDLPYFDTDPETQPFSCAGTEKEKVNPPLCAMDSYPTERGNKSFQNIGTQC